jgi:hypothetical protein
VECVTLTGPVAMPFKRGGALARVKDGVDVVFNDGGKPRVVHVPRDADAVARGEGAADLSLPPCAATGASFYCPDETGAIHRVPREGGPDAIVAHAKKGTRVDALTIAGGHTLVAFLDRTVSAGAVITIANVIVDDGSPERVDETGATAIALAPLEGGALAVTVDARVALTLVHARALSVENG